MFVTSQTGKKVSFTVDRVWKNDVSQNVEWWWTGHFSPPNKTLDGSVFRHSGEIWMKLR
jgi:hypothetical protein